MARNAGGNMGRLARLLLGRPFPGGILAAVGKETSIAGQAYKIPVVKTEIQKAAQTAAFRTIYYIRSSTTLRCGMETEAPSLETVMAAAQAARRSASCADFPSTMAATK